MKILHAILFGVVIAVFGLIFSAFFAVIPIGMSYEHLLLCGFEFYLCVVIVTCTRYIITKL